MASARPRTAQSLFTPAVSKPAVPARGGIRPVQPFASTQEAWFWTMSALVARREGARYTAGLGLVERPCEPDDVVKCLDQLYRRRRIDLLHARILRIWGERGLAPNPDRPSEARDAHVWQEALGLMEWPLRAKGIVR